MRSIAARASARSRVGLCSTRGVLVEREHADVDARRARCVDEARAPRAWRRPAGWAATSVAVIEPRDVGREHDRGALDRHRDRPLRPRGGERRAPRARAANASIGRWRRQRGPARRDRRLQRAARRTPRPRRAAIALLAARSQRDQQREREQREQDQRGGEAHGDLRAGRVAERRRASVSRAGRRARRAIVDLVARLVVAVIAAATSSGSCTAWPSTLGDHVAGLHAGVVGRAAGDDRARPRALGAVGRGRARS